MVEPKPTVTPIWNTGGANRTEPPAGDKTTGWSLNQEPPSSWFNWLQHYTGAWFVWLGERLADGVSEEDFTISALTPDASGPGGEVIINAATANTSGAGGGITLNCGNAVSVGAGGPINLNAGAGAGAGSGGAANVNAGNATGTGNGGFARLNAGDGSNGQGGDVRITGGAGDDEKGGEVVLMTGAGDGTDRNSGNLELSTGDSTGTGRGLFTLEVAESETGGAGSGAYLNTPATYVSADGSLKTMALNRHAIISDPSATLGNLQLVAKAEPTAPLTGDIYLDTSTGQLAIQDGARYHNLNTIVKNISDDAVQGLTPSSVASTTVVLNEWPYPAGPVGSTPLRYIIPANALRAGSIVRIRAIFVNDDIGGGSTFPTPKVYIGSIGVEAPAGEWRAPTGLDLLPNSRASNAWDRARVECEMRVRSLGASGAVDRSFDGSYATSGGAFPVDCGSVITTDTVDTTVALDVFPACLFGTSVGYQLFCDQFLVEII